MARRRTAVANGLSGWTAATGSRSITERATMGSVGSVPERVHPDSVVLATGHAHLGGEPVVARARCPIDDDGGGKGRGGGENSRAGLGVDDHDLGDEIAGRLRSSCRRSVAATCSRAAAIFFRGSVCLSLRENAALMKW